MKILLVSTQDYIHHPIPSRHHYLFEEMATRHEIHVPHFHVSRGEARKTRLIVHEATFFPSSNPLFHYTINSPYHFHILRKIVRNEGIDVVVAANVLAGTAAVRAAKKEKIPVVFDLKDWFPDSAAAYIKNSLLQDIVRDTVWAITSYNLRNSDRVTTVSPSLVEKLNRFKIPADCITNGVDTDLFRPKDGSVIRAGLGIDPKDFVIGFAGSVERWYAIDELIRSLPVLHADKPDTKLLIVGGSLFTHYMKELQALVSDLNVQDYVIFTGIQPYHKLPDFIACMDACTIPLSPPQWADIALPNKFFEYSACGKPIVMRPIPDVLKIGGPNIFTYKTIPELVDRIKYIMDERPGFTPDLNRYSWKEKARQFEDLLISLL
jgi:glycosyltransferase involved in cell wall biosynthesis